MINIHLVELMNYRPEEYISMKVQDAPTHG
jgi:hypothetical protein